MPTATKKFDADIDLQGNSILNATFAPVIHAQNIASAVWTINHNLKKLYPNIVIVDSANELVIGYLINPVDENNITLTFSAAFSGTATLT